MKERLKKLGAFVLLVLMIMTGLVVIDIIRWVITGEVYVNQLAEFINKD